MEIDGKNVECVSSYLISVKFHIDEWHPLVYTAVVLQYSIHSLGNVFHYQI